MIPYWTMQWKEQIHLRFRTGCLAVLREKDCTKMQTVSSEAVWAGTVDFDISLKEGEHGYLYIPGDRAGNCNDQRSGAEIRLLE